MQGCNAAIGTVVKAIGRVWFDQWCIKYARKNRQPVVDLTRFAPIVHQMHDYSPVAGERELGACGGGGQ